MYVRDDAILPSRFLDALIATQVDARRRPAPTDAHRRSRRRAADHRAPLRHRRPRGRRGHPAPGAVGARRRRSPTGRSTLADDVTVGLRRPLVDRDPGAGFVRRAWVLGPDRRPACLRPARARRRAAHQRADRDLRPARRCCASASTSFAEQTLDRSEYEVVVVDDGSDARRPRPRCSTSSPTGCRSSACGSSTPVAARRRTIAVFLARAPIVLFFDDDDRAAPDYLERHLARHDAKPGEAVAILGHTDWAPELELTPLMHYITDVDRLMFAYERLGDGQELDWRGFWEGRISCKRALLMRHGLHDQRLELLDRRRDGLAARARGPAGDLRRVGRAASWRARIDFDAFCDRTEAKGRAHAVIAALHPGTEIATRLQLDDARRSCWDEKRARPSRRCAGR